MLHEIQETMSKSKKFETSFNIRPHGGSSSVPTVDLSGPESPIQSSSTEASKSNNETKRIEQIGNKRRILETSAIESDSTWSSFPLALLSLGRAKMFDVKGHYCTISSTALSFGANVDGVKVSLSVNPDEVEEILFCEPLRAMFLVLKPFSLDRVCEALGSVHLKDEKKKRIVLVMEDRPPRDPYECSVKSGRLTHLQLEAFCTSVRLLGGLTMTDTKTQIAQGILNACGLRLNVNNSAKSQPSTSTTTSSEGTSNPPDPPNDTPSDPIEKPLSDAAAEPELVVLLDDSEDESETTMTATTVTTEKESEEPEEGSDLCRSVRHLPPHGKVRRFVYQPVGSLDGILLSDEDIKCLSPGVYLNDTIINFYLKYLYYEQFSSIQRRSTYLFNSFFYSKLVSITDTTASNAELRMIRHNAVAKWTRRVDLFTKDYIIIPINENLHWFLGLICYPWMVGMVSYGQLYSEHGFDQCRLRPDYADTRIESSATDVGTEDVTPLPTDNQGEAFDRWRRRRLAWLRGRGIEAMPCILLFDSIPSQSRISNLHVIRDYLQSEWNVRRSERDGNLTFDKDTIRGFSPRVPGQTNLVDCGIFLLHYVEMFFKRPVKSYTREYFQNEMSRWFENEMLTKKRSVICKLIEQISRRSNRRSVTAS